MAKGIIISPNPRNQHMQYFPDKFEICIRLFDEHFARHFETDFLGDTPLPYTEPKNKWGRVIEVPPFRPSFWTFLQT